MLREREREGEEGAMVRPTVTSTKIIVSMFISVRLIDTQVGLITKPIGKTSNIPLSQFFNLVILYYTGLVFRVPEMLR